MGWSDTTGGAIRAAIITRLEAHSVFSQAPAISVLSRFTGDPALELDAALEAAGKAGLVVSVSEPEFSIGDGVQGLGTGSFQVIIAEFPELNRGPGGTARTAQEIEEAVIESITTWTPTVLISRIVMNGAPDRPEDAAGMARRIPFQFGILLG